MSDPYRGPSPRAAAETAIEGDATPWELRTWPSERSCPVCAIPLFAASKDGYRLDACGKCGGAWIAHRDVRRMIDTSSKTPIDLARMADSVPAAAEAAPAARECPECRSALVTENLAGVDIDVCDQHGTWFDRHELRHVAVALVSEYGVARRVLDAEAERKRLAAENESTVSLQNVAYGVAAVGLALVGAAIKVPIQHDAFGREVELDVLGREVVKSPK
ncbi:MAG: zf-TFIIB domain-containing protein [Labilithrix sp.]